MTTWRLPDDVPKGERPRRATNSMLIYADLRHRIVTGALRPMQCLSETELALSLGVSRTPVREALGKLEEEDLVEIRPRFGTFVSPILLSSVNASQFVREALECTAILDAAAHCTPAAQRELEAILAQQHAARTDEAFFLADDALHRALMKLAGRHHAWGVVNSAKAVIDRVRFLAMQRQYKRQLTLTQHQQIVDRVADCDPAGAASAMREHLRGVFVALELGMAAHPELFSWGDDGPRANRHRSRQRETLSPKPPPEGAE